MCLLFDCPDGVDGAVVAFDRRWNVKLSTFHTLKAACNGAQKHGAARDRRPGHTPSPCVLWGFARKEASRKGGGGTLS